MRNSILSQKQRKLLVIDHLVKRAKRGELKSLSLLLTWFDPLILKICSRIHHRTNGRISIDELHEAGKQEFTRLTLMYFIPKGEPGFRAEFNYFIQTKLHAELWKYYYPMTKDIPVEASDFDFLTNGVEQDHNDSTSQMTARYLMINLNSAEKSIITNCVMGSMTGTDQAKLMHISKVRVSKIKQNALSKLRMSAQAYGICKEDIG